MNSKLKKQIKNRTIIIGIMSCVIAILFAVLLFQNLDKSFDKIVKTNESYASTIDYKSSRLPTGSVFETESGTWMVIGQRPVSYLSDDFDAQSDEAWEFDYYVVSYPEGCRTPFAEYEDTALFNATDITKVLYVGYLNDTEKDYLNWIDNVYDSSVYNPLSSSEHRSGTLYVNSPAEKEQELRKQGKTTQEINGNNYDGGLLYSDIRNAGFEYANPELGHIAYQQSLNKDSENNSEGE